MLGQLLVVSFFLMVPVMFVVAVSLKLSHVYGVLKETYVTDDDGNRELINAFRRFQIGLATPADVRELNKLVTLLLSGQAGDPHMDAGRRVWRNKMLVSHLDSSAINAVLDVLKMRSRLHRSQEFALHFTSKESARLILHSRGIRASTEGQLAGGVSICMASLDELEWKADRPLSFREATGRALWGSKYQEVLPGGAHEDKLDVALVVQIPARKDPAQFVPGRPAVYIIPGYQLDKEPEEQGGRRFLSNTHIAACLLLQPTVFDIHSLTDIPGQGNNVDHTELKKAAQTQWEMMCAGSRGLNVKPLQDKWERNEDRFSDPTAQGGEPRLKYITAKIAQPLERRDLWKHAHQLEELADLNRPLWTEDVT
jgi:hypothetical protein